MFNQVNGCLFVNLDRKKNQSQAIKEGYFRVLSLFC